MRIMWLCTSPPTPATCPRSSRSRWPAARSGGTGSAGGPPLDLVNTLRERWRRRVETLVTPDDLGLWLVRAQLLPAPQRVTRARLREARELREAIDACVQAAVGRRRRAARRSGRHRRLAGARRRARTLALAGDGTPLLGERAPADAVRRALGAVALDAARMLGTRDEAARIRICASADVLGALLRPLAGGAPALVLDGAVRQRGQGPPPPRALAGRAPREPHATAGSSSPRARSAPARSPRCAWACPRSPPRCAASTASAWARSASPSRPSPAAGWSRSCRGARSPIASASGRSSPLAWPAAPPRSSAPRSRRATRRCSWRCSSPACSAPARPARRAARSWAGSRAPSAASRSASARWRCRSGARWPR